VVSKYPHSIVLCDHNSPTLQTDGRMDGRHAHGISADACRTKMMHGLSSVSVTAFFFQSATRLLLTVVLEATPENWLKLTVETKTSREILNRWNSMSLTRYSQHSTSRLLRDTPSNVILIRFDSTKCVSLWTRGPLNPTGC